MNGTNITGSAALPNPGPTWHVAEAADFNGDGKSDILWQHDSGSPAIWTMDGTNITSNVTLPSNTLSRSRLQAPKKHVLSLPWKVSGRG